MTKRKRLTMRMSLLPLISQSRLLISLSKSSLEELYLLKRKIVILTNQIRHLVATIPFMKEVVLPPRSRYTTTTSTTINIITK